MKRITSKQIAVVSLLSVCLMACLLSGCGKKKLSEINIVYTNDIHSYIDNEAKDNDGNVIGDGLRLSKVSAMVQDMRAEGKNVVLADSGDEIQGDIYGAFDQGESMIELMNKVGYEVAAPGNHEFDYGVLRFLKLRDDADYAFISCNFHSTDTKEIVFPDSKIFDFDGTKVAFIGITTPETITSSTPVYFQNEKGEFIYTIEGMRDPKDLYLSVQNAIDNVKDDVDYIVALGHIGSGLDEQKLNISSADIIQNTSGLNAFIDGHSHSTVECSIEKDKDGNDVVLTQTGSYLNAVGIMTIDEEGKITSRLESDYSREDEAVAALESDIIQRVAQKMNEQIGVLDTELYISNPVNKDQRLVRAMEMNAGDITADAMYWYFNEVVGQNCDVVLQNGGGIRSGLQKGDLTYISAKTVEPFGNMVCLISASGQQIIDALEMGVESIGEWDEEWNAPAEGGGFMQVAGIKYSVDAGIKSSVETDENGMFKAVNGDYKVKDVQVYNRLTHKYEPIIPGDSYTLGGINYILRNNGNGLSMFEGDDLVVDYVGQDYVIFAEYIKNFKGNGEAAVVNTANSPLSSYDGYLLDYENPYGAGRISIENIEYPDETLNNKE